MEEKPQTKKRLTRALKENFLLKNCENTYKSPPSKNEKSYKIYELQRDKSEEKLFPMKN